MMLRRLAFVGFLAIATPASAVEVAIDVTNVAGANGVSLTPFLIAAHDGSFDAFDEGMAASMGVENLAELGDGTALAAEYSASQPAGASGVVTATSGGFGPGIFLPGGSGRITLDLDPAMHRYLSYASMVVPSNDFFIGNDSPTAVELFDAMGNFTGGDVLVTASRIWNAGTEVDDLMDGPAFVVGQDATTGAAEGGVVSLGADLSPFSGAETPAAYTFSTLPTGSAGIARLSFAVVPEPAGVVLAVAAGAAAWGFAIWRKKVTLRFIASG